MLPASASCTKKSSIPSTLPPQARATSSARHWTIKPGTSSLEWAVRQTVDGGAGILTSLGIRFLDRRGAPLTGLPAELINLASIDAAGLDPRLADTRITILCDVDNPLLGPRGAAAVFGPQKGAAPQAVHQLEAALQRLAHLIRQTMGIDISTLPSGGTAGGAAAGLHALLGAGLVNGIDYFLEITKFDEALQRSHLVLTGEGSIDEQTLQGKAPFGVAVRAKNRDIPVIGLAGQLPSQKNEALDRYFDVLLPVNQQLSPLAEALANAAVNLTAAARALGNSLAVGGSLGRTQFGGRT